MPGYKKEIEHIIWRSIMAEWTETHWERSQVCLMTNKHNHSRCELLTMICQTEGKKLEHTEDEPEVMACLLLSLKGRIKKGWSASIVPLHHLNPQINKPTDMQHTDK